MYLCVCKCARVCKCIVQGFENLRTTLLLLILKGTKDITLSEKSKDMWTSRTHQIWLFKFPTVFHFSHYSHVYVCLLPCLEIYKKFFVSLTGFNFFILLFFFSPCTLKITYRSVLRKEECVWLAAWGAAHHSWEGMEAAVWDQLSASAGRKERWMLKFNSLSS